MASWHPSGLSFSTSLNVRRARLSFACLLRLPALLAPLLCAFPEASIASKCLFVSSYHPGYEWSDGVEQGVRTVLEGKCDLQQFDMDTKRYKEPEEIAQKALEVKAKIDTWRPDIVIVADDNAVKYVLMPYYKDYPIPFVFCGVNWTVEEYGLPYRNATGMVEVAPIDPLFDQAEALLPRARAAFYLGAATETEDKNVRRFQEAAHRRGVRLEHRLVNTTAEWLAALQEAQQADFIIMGSHAGIKDWNESQIRSSLPALTQRLSLTNHEWMMSYTMLGLTKVPEEQGEWAATTALHILAGTEPASIPVVPNRKWDIWVNAALLETAGIQLPKKLWHKAKKVQ